MNHVLKKLCFVGLLTLPAAMYATGYCNNAKLMIDTDVTNSTNQAITVQKLNDDKDISKSPSDNINPLSYKHGDLMTQEAEDSSDNDNEWKITDDSAFNYTDPLGIARTYSVNLKDASTTYYTHEKDGYAQGHIDFVAYNKCTGGQTYVETFKVYYKYHNIDAGFMDESCHPSDTDVEDTNIMLVNQDGSLGTPQDGYKPFSFDNYSNVHGKHDEASSGLKITANACPVN